MTNHLTPDEQARLDKIDAALAALDAKAEPLKLERKQILGRARFRKHYRNRS